MPLMGERLGQPQSMLLYSASGLGKTYQCDLILTYLKRFFGWSKEQKPMVRIITWDSTTGPYAKYADEGFADLLPANSIRDGEGNTPVYQVMTAVQKGMWPVSTKTGYRWIGRKGSYKPEPELSGRPEDNGIRAYLTEGISEAATQLLQEHGIKRRAMPEDAKQAGVFKPELIPASESTAGLAEMVVKTGAPTLSHYGDVQLGVLINFLKTGLLSLPVDLVVCTMHEAKGEDDSGMIAYGPELPGKKAVSQVMQKFAHCFHLDWIGKPGGQRGAFYLDAPVSAVPSRNWPAKVTLDAQQSKRFKALYPNGRIPLGEDGPVNSTADLLRLVLENKCG